MIRAVPYEEEHFMKLELRSCHKTENIEGVAGPAMTFVLSDGTPIAIFGGTETVKGIFSAWGILSDLCTKYPKELSQNALHLIEFLFEKKEVRRVQITVRTDYPPGKRWAEFLGFECEGVMKKYGFDNTDYWLMART